jgi:hypothetical protein
LLIVFYDKQFSAKWMLKLKKFYIGSRTNG